MTFSDEPAPDGTGDAPADRRSMVARAARLTTMLLVARITSARHDTLCVIANISTGGLRIKGPASAFAMDEAVTIEVRHAHLLSGRIVWTDGGSFGLRFDEPLDVEAFLLDLSSKESSLDGRYVRAPRLPTDCEVEMRLWGRIHRPAMMDLSQRGARLALGALALEPGTLMHITIPGLPPLRAAVRWVQGQEFGIAFLETVGHAMLSEWFMDPALRYGAGSMKRA